jgi:hypothetical protein
MFEKTLRVDEGALLLRKGEGGERKWWGWWR